MLSTYKKLPKEIYILSIATVIMRSGSFVMAFMTMFLSKKLGMNNELIGVYVMFCLISSTLGGLFGGFLCDKIGRKKVIVYFPFISAILIFICAFLEQSIIIPYILIISNFFHSAPHPATNALIADLTTPEKRSSSYSLVYLSINVGAAVGPIVASFLFNNYLELFFILDAVATIIASLIILTFIKDNFKIAIKDKIKNLQNTNSFSLINGINFLFKFSFLIGFGIILGLIQMTYIQNIYSVPLYIDNIFGLKGANIYGSLISINCITVLVITFLVTSITKKLPPLINIFLGSSLYGVGFVFLFQSKSYILLSLFTIVYTIGEIILATSTQVFIASRSPSQFRGRLNAIVYFISNLGGTLGPMLMGYYIKHGSINTIWIPLMILNVITAILILLMYMFDKKTLKIKELT